MIRTKAISSIIIYFGLLYFIAPLIYYRFDINQNNINSIINSYIIFIVIVFMLIIYINRYRLLYDISRITKKNLLSILKFYGYYLLGSFVIGIIYSITLLEYETSANQTSIENSVTSFSIVLATFLICIFAPIVEELVFRSGIIDLFTNKDKLTNKSIRYLGYAVSILVFTLIHLTYEIYIGYSFMELLSVSLPYVLISSLLVWLYIKSDYNIIVSILGHMFNNAIALIFIFLII